MNKIVTVFGSSMPKPGDEEYEAAYKLGLLLGESGFNVCTGGYQGIMDAVSKGAAEKGAKPIGVTVEIFSAKVSEHLSEEIKCPTLFDRIQKLVELGDAYIILRGGTGTLVELSIVWEMFNKKLMPEKPITCHGKMWTKLVETLDERMKFEGRKFGFVFIGKTIEDCADYVIKKLSHGLIV